MATAPAVRRESSCTGGAGRAPQLVNTAYWQHGKQLVTAGVENSLTYLRTFIPTDEGGLFEFDSLGAFENQISSRYTRQVPLADAPYARQSVLDLGAFAQTEWRPTPTIVTMLGLRYDVTSFLTAATSNELVEQKLGLRTDNTPTDWKGIQPRAQITWDAHADGRDVVRIGAGAFTRNRTTTCRRTTCSSTARSSPISR
jgi:hypothetical protein